MTLHAENVAARLRQRAAAERNAYDVVTALSMLLDDAADLIELAYLRRDITDVPTGGRL